MAALHPARVEPLSLYCWESEAERNIPKGQAFCFCLLSILSQRLTMEEEGQGDGAEQRHAMLGGVPLGLDRTWTAPSQPLLNNAPSHSSSATACIGCHTNQMSESEVEKEEAESKEKAGGRLMFPLRHVNSAQLTAESHLGLQAGRRGPDANPSSLSGGIAQYFSNRHQREGEKEEKGMEEMPAASTMTGGRALLLCTNTDNQSVNGLQCCGLKVGEAPSAVPQRPDVVCVDRDTSKRPLSPLFSPLDGPGTTDTMLAYKSATSDPQTTVENGLVSCSKLNKTPAGLKTSASIRDKISQWEGKKETLPTSPVVGSGPCLLTTVHKEPETVRKKEISEVNRTDSKRLVSWERQDSGKENVGKLGDLRPKSPEGLTTRDREVILDRGSLRGSSKPTETAKENKSVLTHIKKLEQAMKEGPTNPSLVLPGNYFCPPSKEEQEEAERRGNEPIFGTLDVMGSRPVGSSRQQRSGDPENVYTEPGAASPSINPLPKPQRTFQHHTPPSASGLGLGKGRRNLPPLPSIPPPPLPTCPPPGVCRRPWSDRTRDSSNRKSYEFEDLLQSSSESSRVDWYAQSRLGLTRTLSEENVYEDILGEERRGEERRGEERRGEERRGEERRGEEGRCKLPALAQMQFILVKYELGCKEALLLADPPSKENPYEDIELERSCPGNKCSLPISSPSSLVPDTPTKLSSKPGFFRQNSERRSFKLLDLRKTNRDTGISSPSRISPPSTPSSPDDTPSLSGDPYNRRRRKIPKMVLKINGIFEVRRGKKRMKRVSQSTESSSGRVTDDNSESESDTEEKLKAHSQRLSSVQSMLRQTGRYRTLERDLMDLHERKLFEYFIVVALQKTKAGAPYLPEVTQQLPLKLERSFKFMRETEDQLKVIPQFCFPDAKDWAPVDNFPSTLSQCCHAVVALLYPFTWQHTYIPVLPPSMLDIVCTPTPFIVGLLSSSLPSLKELPIEEVLVVDLGNSRFLRQLDDEDSILPHKLQAALEYVLDKRKELASEMPTNSSSLSTMVSETFVRFFVEMVGHYPLFMGGGDREDESGAPSSPTPSCFQREAFRKAVTSKSLKRFLEVFMETQMFAGFVAEREQRRQGLRGLFEVRSQDYLDSLPGNKMKFLSKK
ncbi:unnamed protein product [Coregonus sp. 'balchen']|nr:unnamed protein product [Coregonus sp. 'balchen']